MLYLILEDREPAREEFRPQNAKPGRSISEPDWRGEIEMTTQSKSASKPGPDPGCPSRAYPGAPARPAGRLWQHVPQRIGPVVGHAYLVGADPDLGADPERHHHNRHADRYSPNAGLQEVVQTFLPMGIDRWDGT